MNLIIAHGDADGVICAALIIKKYNLSLDDTVVRWAQPFSLPADTILDNADVIYVADIGVNFRNIRYTTDFIEKIKDKLVIWYDHHRGWERVKNKDERFVINAKAKSCASMIMKCDLSEVADECDQGAPKSFIAEFINSVLKADIRNNKVKISLMRMLLKKATQRDIELIGKAREDYKEIERNSIALAKRSVDYGNIAVIDIRGERVDKLVIINDCFDRGYRAVVLMTRNGKDTLYTMVIKEGSLSAKFGRKFPNDKRATMKESEITLEAILRTLSK